MFQTCSILVRQEALASDKSTVVVGPPPSDSEIPLSRRKFRCLLRRRSSGTPRRSTSPQFRRFCDVRRFFVAFDRSYRHRVRCCCRRMSFLRFYIPPRLFSIGNNMWFLLLQLCVTLDVVSMPSRLRLSERRSHERLCYDDVE